MSKNNHLIFKVMQVIAWLIFVGLCIEAGGLLVNFIFSLVRPEMVSRLYNKLDLSALYQINPGAFFGMYGFILTIAILKACLFYIVIRLIGKLDLAKPFSPFAARQIKLISYYTFSIGLISYIGSQVAESLLHYGYDTENLTSFWADSRAFILMAGIIYVIATIFTKGVEIQTENDLTV